MSLPAPGIIYVPGAQYHAPFVPAGSARYIYISAGFGSSEYNLDLRITSARERVGSGCPVAGFMGLVVHLRKRELQ